MKNTKGSNTERTIGIVCLIFLIIGTVWMLVGVKMLVKTDTTEGIITRIYSSKGPVAILAGQKKSGTNIAYVDYEYEGEEFKDIELPTFWVTMKKGKKITLFIDPKVPSMPHTGGELIFIPLLFVGFGGLGVWVWIFAGKKSKKKSGKEKRLVKQQKFVTAKIVSVDVNEKVAVMDKRPFTVTCVYSDEYSGKEYSFTTEKQWRKEEDIPKVGMEVRVYVDEKTSDDYYAGGQKYSEYYVDLDSAVWNEDKQIG